MTLTCNKVETVKPKRGRARCTCTSDKDYNCSTNQKLSKEAIECGSVKSFKLAYMGSTDPTYIFCSQYDSVNDNQTFTCTGVRPPVGMGNRDDDDSTGNDQVFKYLEDTTDIYEKFNKNDSSGKSYIKHGDINPLNTNNYLGKEINRRKQHIWYNNLQLPTMNDVVAEDPIKHQQQNTLNAILDSIRKSIKDNNDYKNNATITKKASNVGSGDMVETENLRYIETDLLNINKDCICYSDCTNFKLVKTQTCTCNINCGCNYS